MALVTTFDKAFEDLVFRPTVDYLINKRADFADMVKVITRDLMLFSNQMTAAEAQQSNLERMNADSQNEGEIAALEVKTTAEAMRELEPSIALCKAMTAERERRSVELVAQGVERALQEKIEKHYDQPPVANLSFGMESLKWAHASMLKDGKGQPIFPGITGTTNPQEVFLPTKYSYFRKAPILASLNDRLASQLFLGNLGGPIISSRPSGQALNDSEQRDRARLHDQIKSGRGLGLATFEKMIARRTVDPRGQVGIQAAEMLKELYRSAGYTPDGSFPQTASVESFDRGLAVFFEKNFSDSARADSPENYTRFLLVQTDRMISLLDTITDELEHKNRVEAANMQIRFHLNKMNDPDYK